MSSRYHLLVMLLFKRFFNRMLQHIVFIKYFYINNFDSVDGQHRRQSFGQVQFALKLQQSKEFQMIQARWSLIAILFFSGAALADASDYDYVEAGYLDSESGGLDFDGFGIGGSFQFFDNFYLTLRYADVTLDSDIAGVDADGEQFSGGVGYIFGENDRGTFFGEITYIDASISASGDGAATNLDQDGFGVGLGFRTNVAERGEFKLSLTRVEVDSVSDNLVSAQIVYDFFPKVSGVVDLESASGDTTMLFGVRYTFK